MHFPTYRQQGLLIARGYPLIEMMCQIYSNKGDKLKGRQLPIMYSDKAHGFFSISGNLGDAIPAGGRLGDGGGDQGRQPDRDGLDRRRRDRRGRLPQRDDLRRGLQRAGHPRGRSTTSGRSRASRALPAPSARPSPQRAVGYGIAGLRVDGNDALAVYAAVQWAAERARSNDGPTLIEFFTYRAEGHSTSDDPSRLPPDQRGQGVAARRPDRAAEGAPPRDRRMGRGAARGDDRRMRRGGPRRAEGIREARHPARAGQGRHRDRCSTTSMPRCRGISPSSASRRSAEGRD